MPPNLARLSGTDASDAAAPGARIVLFEVAWEVCNQVGGIYQVVRSKVPTMVERWKSRYWLIGPYLEAKAAVEFEPARPPGWMSRVISSLRDEGLAVHYGRWLVPGNPRVLLVEHAVGAERLGELKYRLWAEHAIETPAADPLIDGAISFGDGARRLLERIAEVWGGQGPPTPPALRAAPDGRARRVLVHFHEWLGSMAIPALKRAGAPIATAFTTHATILGRYIASSEEGFYERLPTIDAEAEARRYAVVTQHQVERACARDCDVLTTVSSITGEECAQLLGRAPDLVTPNGLNIRQYYAAHEMQTRHAHFKERIHLFTMGHFFPSYAFDLDRTLYFFTSGRFEPRNKGFDLCLDALARLNAELRAARLGITVVFFIISQRPTVSLHPAVLEKRGVLNELRDVCQHITDSLGEALFRHGAAGERIHLDDQVDEYWRLRYRRTQFALRAGRLPLIVTHSMMDDAHDPVLVQLRRLNLINRQEDPVKVVYHPEFISPVNPLWGVEYEQFVRGCHLGLFPSAYEPWGYTPLECAALGVPAVTSDLAGFGRYVSETYLGHEELGLTVLRRRGRTPAQAADDLARTMMNFCSTPRRDRIALRNAVERSSWEFDWRKLGAAYHKAHDLALQRAEAAGPDRPGVAT